MGRGGGGGGEGRREGEGEEGRKVEEDGWCTAVMKKNVYLMK